MWRCTSVMNVVMISQRDNYFFFVKLDAFGNSETNTKCVQKTNIKVLWKVFLQNNCSEFDVFVFREQKLVKEKALFLHQGFVSTSPSFLEATQFKSLKTLLVVDFSHEETVFFREFLDIF